MPRHNNWTTGAAAIIAAAFGVVVPQPSVAQAQITNEARQPSADDALLLQMVVGSYKLSNEIRGYQIDKGTCLDLADVIQALDLPIRLDKKSRRATGWLFTEDQKFALDRAANTVQNVNSGNSPLAGEIYDTPEGWCVDTKALSRWFGITLKPDLFNSAIRLESDAKLPFMEALERRSRAARLRPSKVSFDLSAYPHADSEYKMWRTPSVDAVVRFGYDTAPGSSKGASGRYEVFAAGEIAGASFDARLSSDNTLQPNSLRVSAFRYDSEGGLLGPLNATQVMAGDVETDSSQLTGQSAVGRGFYLSNQPLGRKANFSTTTVRGTLPGGWDAELYRNGQLIGFQTDTSDGRYEFSNVDLYYGENDLEVVLYGPQGQIRRERFDHPVGQNNVEPGKTYYWAGILQDDRDLIDLRDPVAGKVHAWRGGIGVERGIDQRTSIGFGVQSLYFGGRRRNYLEGNLVRTMGAMQVELAGAWQSSGGAALQANVIGRVGRINFGADATWVQGGFASEFAGIGLSRKVGLNFDTSLKLGKFALPVQASVGQSVLKDGSKVTRSLIQTAFGLRNFALTTQLQHDRTEAGNSQAANATTRLRLLANTRQFGLRFRGAANFKLSGRDKGLETVKISTEKSLGERSDLASEVEYRAVQKDTNFSLGYTHRFDRLALRANTSYSTSGTFGINLGLSFSFGPDPVNGGIRFSEKKLARNGQAAVTVFRDENGDGLRGPGEDVLKDVYVEAGLRTTNAVTDENGRTIVDDLRPFIPILVGIDEGSLSDPYLAPSTKGIVVVPRPGIATVIELPVSPSGEVEGVIQSPMGVELAGVALELLDMRGTPVASTMSEFDGFFLFERVPYGRYRLRVGADSARALAVRTVIDSPVEISRGKDVARLGIVRLQQGPVNIAKADQLPDAMASTPSGMVKGGGGPTGSAP